MPRPCLLLLVAVNQLSCIAERSVAVLTAADCEPTLRRPISPRIVEVREDASLHVGPPCATANCLAGAPGAWGYRAHDDTIHIAVGARAFELPSTAVNAPPSRVAAKPALRGFAIGSGVAVIDRGLELEIALPQSSVRVPAPPLADGEEIAAVRHVDGGTELWIRNTKLLQPDAHGRGLVVVPPQTPRPRMDASRVFDGDDHLVGWLLPGEPGSIMLVTGATVALPMPIPPVVSSAIVALERFVVTVRKRRWVVAANGAIVAELPRGALLHAHTGMLYVVGKDASVFVVDERGLLPWMPSDPRRDLADVPLPEWSRIERISMSLHDGRALFVERVRLPTCTIEDRVFLVDLGSKSVRTLGGRDFIRLHPTFAGDRFRFVEADASVETFPHAAALQRRLPLAQH